MRALHTAATGMMAQELNVQVISNNIANMRTTGYKRQRAEFQDMLYEHVRRIGTQTSTQGNILPVGVDLGSGVKTVGTPRIMTQGTLLPTGNTFDVAIRGEGFFKIQMPDGTFTYTRDGSFQMDAQGRIVTPQGNVVQPGITVPPNATALTISPQGQVSVTLAGQTTSTVLGQLTLTRFVNKAGLQATGDNLFVVKHGKLRTPPISAGILEGITRNAVIDLASAADISVEEITLTRHDVYSADECFLTGTAAEVIAVVKSDGRLIGDGRPGPITRRLRERFQQLVRE